MNSFAAITLYGSLNAIVLIYLSDLLCLRSLVLLRLSRLAAVGYSVALFFVIFKAPDLALTQLVIETVSVALFLLAFNHLPTLSNVRGNKTQ